MAAPLVGSPCQWMPLGVMLRAAWSTLELACVTRRAEGHPFSASPHSLVILNSFDSLRGGTLVACVFL